MELKVKYLNFAITQSVVNIFAESLHADRGTINMKHIKCDFRSKAWVRPFEWTYGVGSKGQYSTFSEHGHVAYQIKGNQKCSNMVANILPADPRDPGDVVKIQFFQNMDMLHIKLKGITNAATC